MREIPKTIKVILKPIYRIGKSIIYKLQDFYDILKGNRNPLVPPRSKIFIGDGDYLKTGDEFMKYFKEFGGLKPNHKVLDVGCGIGRMAVPLTKYLSKDGEYYGFDIVKMGIDWCKKNFTDKYPNFNFEHIDIYNKHYNPNGIGKSSDYKFNYKDSFFDFVFLTSVFTHMRSTDINRYLAEISRVMKPDGRCLITFFLLNAESTSLIIKEKSTQNIIYKLDDNSFTKDKNVPEKAIGFNEDYIKELFYKNDLNIIQPIHYGSWCGRTNFVSYQDIIVAEKI